MDGAGGREALAQAADWLEQQVRAFGVEVALETPVDGDVVAGWPEDAVVIQADGAQPVVSGLRGIERALSLEQALEPDARLDGPVLIVDELDDEPVYAAAEALARHGLVVRLVSRRLVLGRHVPWVGLLGIRRRLDEAGVAVETLARPVGVEHGELVLAHSFSGREFTRPRCATIVCAGPFRPAAPLESHGRRVLRIGDALALRGMQAVALEAHRVALELDLGAG